jgi:hypothetical protein
MLEIWHRCIFPGMQSNLSSLDREEKELVDRVTAEPGQMSSPANFLENLGTMLPDMPPHHPSLC